MDAERGIDCPDYNKVIINSNVERGINCSDKVINKSDAERGIDNWVYTSNE